jgi:hypothetical protein
VRVIAVDLEGGIVVRPATRRSVDPTNLEVAAHRGAHCEVHEAAGRRHGAIIGLGACDHACIARFIVTIEGPGWTDVQDVELPRLPQVGESLETKYGTLLVAQAEEAPDLAAYAGKIVARFS